MALARVDELPLRPSSCGTTSRRARRKLGAASRTCTTARCRTSCRRQSGWTSPSKVIRSPGSCGCRSATGPPTAGRFALLLGGLESTKEESYAFENLCLERGLATFAFDGPGQGEFHFHVNIQPDFERYATAVVDYLVIRGEVCADRIGVLGRSLGGHYAIRCAAHDHRLRACVSWGGSWSEEPWGELPETELRAWLYAAGFTENPDGALDYLRSSLDLADIAHELRAPTIAVLGGSQLGRDEGGDWIDAGMEYNLDLHIDDFPPDTIELVIVPGGDHCCHNRGQFVRPQMADWLADRLA